MENGFKAIVQTCREIDELARDIYAGLSDLCGNDELKTFWMDMSREEGEHVQFWEQVQQISETLTLPPLFDDPDTIIEELRASLQSATQLFDECKTACSTGQAFLVAYRLEFYLLHPAFEIMFHYLSPVSPLTNPQDTYETHIDEFINMLAKHTTVSPELELLGKTLKRLWHENKALARQASHDYLTGLLNRRGFFIIANQMTYLCVRQGSPMSVLMLDIDHFKELNDTHGHALGDAVLQKTADLMLSHLRTSDMVCRWGGEEFVVLLPDTSVSDAAIVAEKIRHQAADIQTIQGIDVTFSVSIGVTGGFVSANPDAALRDMLNQSDLAMYEAKARGRNCVVRFTEIGS